MIAPNDVLANLLVMVEAAIDDCEPLTRLHTSGHDERAEFVFCESGWCVRVAVRNRAARGVGSRGFYSAQGNGSTPEDAVAHLVDRLPLIVEATK